MPTKKVLLLFLLFLHFQDLLFTVVTAGEADVMRPDGLATVVFFVIVGTVAIYGLSASPLARWLRLSDDKRTGVLIAGGDAWIRDFAIELRASNIPVVLVDTNFNKIAQARMAGLNAVCANILNGGPFCSAVPEI